jgi:hypothetical protein
MNFKQYNPLYNFIWFQLIWFTSVLGGDNWITALVTMLLFHLLIVDDIKAELQLMITGAAIGITIDNLLTYHGIYLFNEQRALMDFPLWMMAIWLGFCGTIRHSMKFMTARPFVMIIAAAIFAPLSYAAANRLGAVEFPMGNIYTAMITGFSWMVITAFLLFLNHFFSSGLIAKRSTSPATITPHELSH